MGIKSGRRTLIDTLFGGNRDPLGRIIFQVDDATSPNGVVVAPIGTFLIIDYNDNAADNDVYINTNGHATAGSATWAQVYNSSDTNLGKIY